MRSLCFSLAVLGLTMIAWSQEVVYDNTATYQGRNMRQLHTLKSEGAELGDEVKLAGTDREVVELKLRFWYGGTNEAIFDAKIRLRAMSKDKWTQGQVINGKEPAIAFKDTLEPGAVIYESKTFHDMHAQPGMNEYTFKIPRVKVPDRFVWTIQTSHGRNLTGDLGPAYYNAPTVGSSEDFFWHSDQGSPWIPYSWGADPYCNFGARITAVDSKKTGNPVVPPSR